jgi:hypothetical protein
MSYLPGLRAGEDDQVDATYFGPTHRWVKRRVDFYIFGQRIPTPFTVNIKVPVRQP